MSLKISEEATTFKMQRKKRKLVAKKNWIIPK